MDFEFLEHTADLKFKAYGACLNKAFENAGLAFFEAITDTKKVKHQLHKVIEVKSEDLKSLLYDFLEELLVLHEADQLIFSKFKIEIDEKNYSLVAELWGEPLRKDHEIRNLVKAVTYNEMIIKKGKNIMIQVVLDI